MTLAASYRERVPRGSWGSMIGTFCPLLRTRRSRRFAGETFSLPGRRLWGAHELEWIFFHSRAKYSHNGA
jgi:hypothetical protein